MSQWPGGAGDAVPLSSLSYLHTVLSNLGAHSGGMTASVTWPASGRVFYAPVIIRMPLIVSRMSLPNGSATNGARDLGVYDLAGNKLTSTGSHAMSGTNVNQVVNVSTITLGPGMYYLAAVIGGTGSSFKLSAGSLGTAILNATGFAQEAVDVFPLPATASFASANSVYLPIIKIGNHLMNFG